MKKKPVPECKKHVYLTPQYLNESIESISKSALSWKNRKLRFFYMLLKILFQGPLLSIDWNEENSDVQSYKPLPSNQRETVIISQATFL